MEMKLVRAFELGAERTLEVVRGEQARDFPFVLDGDQLVIGARDGGRHRLAETGLALGGAHAFDERPIALRVRLASGGQNMRCAPINQRVERRRRFALGLAACHQPLDAGQVMRGAPPPFERLLIGRDRNAVELDRAINRSAPERNEFPFARPRRA